ncbi:S1 CSL4 protein [Kockovaella imperatae]|uniref:S1 CSL4 protein n=1 Tax=Kockovaella imperatae TaxID=4999 RepID=A0A1Y1USX2_9TREE|nr:S1 CSL4 protein [Kockovaella imperatae]ORX40305.1 S1 CSL4 protein [Kockovaella imperatae]
MASSSILLPGQPLPSNLTQPPLPQCGPGCYEFEGKILASIIGRPYRDGATVGVKGRDDGAAVPDVDAIVTGTVTRITAQQAHLNISTVNNRPVPESSEEFVGVVRIADIRLTERDKIKMGECFRLGDLVKARVLSLGDARSYYLSTAANELGVVSGTSEAGNPLIPASFQEMEDAITGRMERRKVAKPEGV